MLHILFWVWVGSDFIVYPWFIYRVFKAITNRNTKRSDQITAVEDRDIETARLIKMLKRR